MNKTNKNLFFLFIASRITDLGSTYIAGDGLLYGETNFLVSYFKQGWLAMIILNIFVFSLVYWGLTKHTNKYLFEAEGQLRSKKIDFITYLSFVYYKKRISLGEFLIYGKIDYKVLLNSFVQLFIIALTMGGFIISVNNILNSFNYINLYSYNNVIYQKFLPNILFFIIFMIVSYFYHKNKYRVFLKN